MRHHHQTEPGGVGYEYSDGDQLQSTGIQNDTSLGSAFEMMKQA